MFVSVSGLPYFSPDFELVMSSFAYASALKNLGGAHKTKNPGSTGGFRSTPHEDIA